MRVWNIDGVWKIIKVGSFLNIEAIEGGSVIVLDKKDIRNLKKLLKRFK